MFRSSRSDDIGLPRISDRSAPHYPFRGLLSVYSRYSLHACQVAYATLYTEGFGDFVTSITAPIASGWSDRYRVGFAPTGDPRLFTAH
jgi:hypothetical protein